MTAAVDGIDNRAELGTSAGVAWHYGQREYGESTIGRLVSLAFNKHLGSAVLLLSIEGQHNVKKKWCEIFQGRLLWVLVER